MSEREHHGEKELASFIRAGAERRPEQAYGDYFKGQRASCALGAAYEGIEPAGRPDGLVTAESGKSPTCMRPAPSDGCKRPRP